MNKLRSTTGEGITFPTKVKDISVWEKNNGISVNVFGYDTDEMKIYTIRLCDIGSSVMIDDNGQVVPTKRERQIY